MPYSKGISGNPTGRKKGSKNLTTKQARELMNQILFGELDNIREALSEVRKADKGKYLDCLTKLFPFSLPKKTDLTSDNEPLSGLVNITVASSKGAEELKDFLNETDPNRGIQ